MDWVLVARHALNILNGITMLALVALGLYIVFNLMGVINLAHGEFLMLGAYTQLTLTGLGINFWVAAVITMVVVALIGMAVEQLVLRSLYREGALPTVLATWGVSIVFQEVITFIYGAQPKFVRAPVLGPVRIGPLTYPAYHLVIMILAWVVLATVIWLLLRTRFGVAVRATMNNPTMAGALGISTVSVYRFAFGLGSGLAGLAGVLLAPIVGVLPTMGLPFIAQSFFTVIIGGTGSIFSMLGGAATISGTENILTLLSNPIVAHLGVLVLVIVTMYLRPDGLFTRKGRQPGI